ncbi:MAG: ATP-grasp fold amidoligase family protein [Treponemataceae bacterium]
MYKFIKRCILKAMSLGFFNWLSDVSYLKWKFKLMLGYPLDLENPKTFNEKLNWLKLNDRKPEYTKLVDKYAVREYIANKIGKEYLVPLIGVYETIDDVPWAELPNRFVLKCTSGSGGNIICKDKSTLDLKAEIKKFKKFFRQNYFYNSREYVYKDITPKIIIEQFISENEDTPDDYKFMCFNGTPKLIQVHRSRFSDMHSLDFYDTNWNKTSISQGNLISDIDWKKPECFDLLFDLSSKLSKDFFHVRVDWYIVDKKIYFGELTFQDGAGFDKFDSYEDDLLLGLWLKLPVDSQC